MKKFLILALIGAALSPATHAAPVIEIDVEMSLDGALARHLSAKIQDGQSAGIESVDHRGNGYALTVTPQLQPKASPSLLESVLLKFEIFRVQKGEKTLLARPQVIGSMGEAITISQSSDDPKAPLLDLSVTPTLTPAD